MGAPRQLLRIHVKGVGDTALRSGDELRIGRHPSNDIVVDEKQVSRRHARFVWERLDGEATIEDLGSSNGVFVNGTKINKSQPLKGGDAIEIGSLKMEVNYQVDRGVSRRVRRPTYAAQLTGEPTRKGWLSARLTLKTLLESLGEDRKTGVLQLGGDDEGKVIVLKLGRVINAEIAAGLKPPQALRIALDTKPGAMYRFFLKPDVEGPLDFAPKSLFMDASATARWETSDLSD